MLSCKQVADLASRAQDEKIGLGQHLKIKLHLMLCRGCRHYWQQISWLRRATKALLTQHDNVPSQLPDEARQRIEQRLKSRSAQR